MNIERVNLLIEKINNLRNNISKESPDMIDIDLMLDYTRVLYADLLELRRNTLFVVGDDSKKETARINTKSDDEIILDDEDISKNIYKESPAVQAPILEKPMITPDFTEEKVIMAKPEKDTIESIPATQKPWPLTSNATTEARIDLPQNKARDIRQHITINDKFLFMSELFKNDKFDYESALDILNNHSNINAAHEWIEKNYFSTNIWDKNSHTVESFLNAVIKSYK